MDTEKLARELEKIKDVSQKIKMLEKMILSETNSENKRLLQNFLNKIKSNKPEKKQNNQEKKPETNGKKPVSKPQALEEMVVRGNVFVPETNLRLTDAEYQRQFGSAPISARNLSALTEPSRDRLKEDYVQKKDYIEKKEPGQQTEYVRTETSDYIERPKTNQFLGFRSIEEQNQIQSSSSFNTPPRTDEEYLRQEQIHGAIREKELELNRQEYLREKKKKEMMMG